MSECGLNTLHVATFTCMCPEGFNGAEHSAKKKVASISLTIRHVMFTSIYLTVAVVKY